MSVEDAVAKKTIETNMETPDAEFLEFKEFSVDLEKSLESLNVSVELISTIVKEAKKLLNIKNAIQKMPSLEPSQRGKYMVAAKTCQNGLYESIVYRDHCSCTCQCFKHNKICKHSLCVAEVSGILSQHLEYLRKTKGRSNPSRSELVEPTKQAQGEKGGCHKNPWRPPRALLADENKVQSERPCHPYSEIHHNNKPLIVCFFG